MMIHDPFALFCLVRSVILNGVSSAAPLITDPNPHRHNVQVLKAEEATKSEDVLIMLVIRRWDWISLARY